MLWGLSGLACRHTCHLHFRVPGRQSLTGLPGDLGQGPCDARTRCPRRSGGAVPGSAARTRGWPLVTRSFDLTDGGQSSGKTPLQTMADVKRGRTPVPALGHFATY